MSVDRYKLLHSEWMDDRSNQYGAMPQPEEAKWAERLDDAWRELTEDQQAIADEWVREQHEWRSENGIPLYGKEFEISPEECAQLMFGREYELIIAEDEKVVVFQIDGRDITISRGVLLDYDSEKFWISRRDAESMGLLQ